MTPIRSLQDAKFSAISSGDDAVEAGAPGVSLLDSILFLLTPEQQQEFLASAGNERVVYANRAPTFNKPIALKINKPRFRELLGLLGRPVREVSAGQWDCNYEDPEPLSVLKSDLEAGVRIAPPPRGWFDYPEGDDVPIRIDSRRFGIPCRVRPHKYGGTAYLEATALETADNNQSIDNTADELESDEALDDGPADLVGANAVPVSRTADAPRDSDREFTPHFATTWHVLGPNSRLSPDFDKIALGRLVSQLVASGRHLAISGATRKRCEMLVELLKVKKFASQYPYTLERDSGGTFELRVEGPPETLADIKRAYVYQDAADGSRRDCGVVLDRVGWRTFRFSEGRQGDAPPASGYLVDSGEDSQLQKQMNALRELRFPGGRPHLLQLGTLVGDSPNGPAESVPWEATQVQLIDTQLTIPQAEAVRKALATPDVCLIQGPPGTGKTRVISEIVRQAVRANWKVLLVAPTHVAVDNVLERIGFQEEVSPVRCVRQEKIGELPENIQEFTYERRSGLLASETGRRSEADRPLWQDRCGRLASDLEILKQGAVFRLTADQVEREITRLRAALAEAPKQARLQFAGESNAALDVEQAAENSLGQEKTALELYKQELARSTVRIGDLGEQRYGAEDRRRLEAAEAGVRRAHATAIKSATGERDEVSAAVTKLGDETSDGEKRLAEAQDIVVAIDQGQLPLIVERVVDAAVAETTAQHDKLVAQRQEVLSGAHNELEDARRRIAAVDRTFANARDHSRSLKEAQTKAIPLRLFNGSWWGSFFTDYEKNAAEASQQSSFLQGQCPTLQERIRRAEELLEEARVNRVKGIEETRSKALAQQHHQYREIVSLLPKELDSLRSELRDSEQRLQLRQAALSDPGLRTLRRAMAPTCAAPGHPGP